jgi:hypothetical protein
LHSPRIGNDPMRHEEVDPLGKTIPFLARIEKP